MDFGKLPKKGRRMVCDVGDFLKHIPVQMVIFRNWNSFLSKKNKGIAFK
jgi:hypothetical protein